MQCRVDMTGRTVLIPDQVSRIVSLVPSQTELIHYLGKGDTIVGRTVFCIHPSDKVRNAENIGGTKKVRYEKIDELKPDLIICNKEENTTEIVEKLSEKYPVWVSDVKNLTDTYDMIREIAAILGVSEKGTQLNQSLQNNFRQLRIRRRFSALYLIWRKPYMSIGSDTFIHHMMETAGLYNVLRQSTRYPELDSEEIAELKPEVVLLSTEPYPFNESHVEEIRAILPSSKIILADGEMFSWYGSHLLNSQAYFNELQRQLHRGINN